MPVWTKPPIVNGMNMRHIRLFWDIHTHTVVAKRMTQIWISTKIVESVSFVRCYYGRLKYNYKHFIRVKCFYRQLHEVDAKSQYLQCWPFFFKTSAIHPGMLSINLWATSWLMAAHSCTINAWSLSEVVGFCLSTHLLRIVLNGIKVWGVSWPWTQNIDVLFPKPL